MKLTKVIKENIYNDVRKGYSYVDRIDNVEVAPVVDGAYEQAVVDAEINREAAREAFKEIEPARKALIKQTAGGEEERKVKESEPKINEDLELDSVDVEEVSEKPDYFDFESEVLNTLRRLHKKYDCQISIDDWRRSFDAFAATISSANVAAEMPAEIKVDATDDHIQDIEVKESLEEDDGEEEDIIIDNIDEYTPSDKALETLDIIRESGAYEYFVEVAKEIFSDNLSKQRLDDLLTNDKDILSTLLGIDLGADSEKHVEIEDEVE